jgi:OFA family oxalate/formate antiporter-like MFS transporter
VVVGAALFMRNPPKGYRPAGWQPAAWTSKHRGDEYTLRQALGTWQWYALAATLFLSASAGISLLSEAAPMASEITGVSAVEAAGLVSIIAIANGAGRLL